MNTQLTWTRFLALGAVGPIALALLFITPGRAARQGASTGATHGPAQTAPAAKSGTNSPTEVTRETLPNGLRVIFVRDTLAPVVTTVMNYLVGSNEAPSGFPGMAHAQEHMMFRGSPGLSADQLAAISAQMGGNFDADTQQTVTQYFFTVPSGDLDVALHIESLRMKGVLDSQSLWEPERGAIEQEVARDLSNPQYVFYTQLLEAMFKGTPYAHDALGTKASFDRTTGEMLHDFFEKWYAPNNAILVIAGDIEPSKAMPEIQKLFGDIPKKEIPPHTAVHEEAVAGKTLELKTDLPYGLAVVTFRTPGSDSHEFATLKVLGDVLSSQRGTLYDLVPQGKALDAGFSYEPLPALGVASAMAAFPQGANGDQLVQEIEQIVAKYVKNGIPADLVEAAKRHELTNEELQKNSIEGLAMEWSNAVAVEGRGSPEDDVAAIEKVTANDVNAAARKYLATSNAVVAVLTPQPAGAPLSSSSFGGAEALAGTPKGRIALPAWAQAAIQRLDAPKLTTSPVETTLPNGLHVVVQPEAISDTVVISGHVKNNPDLETPDGQEGAESVVDDLFSYGTNTLDRVAFQKALDDIGANESAGVDFNLEVLSSRFDRGAQLLADNLLHPALPDEGFKIVQQETAQAVAGQLHSPDYLTMRALHAELFPKNDPSLREATPQSVKALTLDDVKGYYQKVFRPDLTTIVVIGNISADQARSTIEKYFGDWKAAGARPATDLPAVPANSAEATTVPDQSRVQDKVQLAETLGLNRFSLDYYALELGNGILGGGFYATRLYHDLRETAGLVYNVGSAFEVGKTRAIYTVDYACDPQNVSKARAIVVRDLRAMQSTLPSDDELDQAKAMLVRRVPLSEASVDSIAAGWIRRTDLGLPLNEPDIAARHYVELTAQNVRDAYAKWLRPGDFAQVTEGPAPR